MQAFGVWPGKHYSLQRPRGRQGRPQMVAAGASLWVNSSVATKLPHLAERLPPALPPAPAPAGPSGSRRAHQASGKPGRGEARAPCQLGREASPGAGRRRAAIGRGAGGAGRAVTTAVTPARPGPPSAGSRNGADDPCPQVGEGGGLGHGRSGAEEVAAGLFISAHEYSSGRLPRTAHVTPGRPPRPEAVSRLGSGTPRARPRRHSHFRPSSSPGSPRAGTPHFR